MKKNLLSVFCFALVSPCAITQGSILIETESASLLLGHNGVAWLTSISVEAAPPVPVADVTFQMNEPVFREVDGVTYRVMPAPGTEVANPMVPTEPEFHLQTGNLSGVGLIHSILALNVTSSTFTPNNSAVAVPLDVSGAQFVMYRDLPASNPIAISTASSTLAYTLPSNFSGGFNLGFSEWGTYDLVFTLIALDGSLSASTEVLEFSVAVPEPSTYGLILGFFAVGILILRRHRR